jgi:hypothetical protein
MTIANKLKSMLEDAFKLAEAEGYNLGGVINVHTKDWKRVAQINIVREVPRRIIERPPTGDVCVKCGGSRFQQTGTCKTCLDCGEPGGCS